METCSVCGKQATGMLFTMYYNDADQTWELGSHVCEECAGKVLDDGLTDEEKEDRESARFHEWVDTQR